MASSPSLKVTILGSGTSTGVPMPGCECAICRSPDSMNKRLRTSALVSFDDKNVVIDAGPDFREQMLRADVQHLDAVLFTHAHADHILGIDDLRPYNFKQRRSIPCYGTSTTLDQIRRIFFYIFDRDPTYTGGGVSDLSLYEIKPFTPFNIFGLTIEPFPLLHGNLQVMGFKIGDFAYATDCKEIPTESATLLGGIDTLVLGGLREQPHNTHMSISEAVEAGNKLGAKNLYLTHMSHSVDYRSVSDTLPSHVALCYDGLVLDIKR